MAACSKAQVYGRLPIAILGSNPTGGMDFYLLSGRGLCDELITRSEESYRQWRVVVCDHENLVNEEATAIKLSHVRTIPPSSSTCCCYQKDKRA
jgi:hypothetical protein